MPALRPPTTTAAAGVAGVSVQSGVGVGGRFASGGTAASGSSGSGPGSLSCKPSTPTPTPTPTTTTTRVGRYEMIRTIGQGTFGKVKLARDVATGRTVAMKSILKKNVKTAKQMNSVQREVRLMKLLQHEHIVQVYETLETPDNIYIVMEHASGGELFDFIVTNGNTSEQTARHFFRQVVAAIDYCHKNSIIHRDLKPENLLLDDNGNIKIIDFGFGNTFHRDRTLDTYCGSPFYAAPEMVKGTPYIGPEVDIWSLGVILYALLNGRLPFDTKEMSVLYAMIAKGAYAPMQVSPAAENLIQMMLTVNPICRAKMHEIIDHPWTNIGYPHKVD
ncbi:kinase-like domain-containing protein, partial [Zopfochytrium polystomum]